jgi:hypothetical protein
VRYIRRDLLEWLHEHRVRSTSESRCSRYLTSAHCCFEEPQS